MGKQPLAFNAYCNCLLFVNSLLLLTHLTTLHVFMLQRRVG